MIFKKKEFFLLIFLIVLQSCSGGGIGNFLESSFKDLEKISQDEDLQKNLVDKKIVLKENKEINNQENKKIKQLENPKNIIENNKDTNLENIAKQKNNKDTNLENIANQKNNKVKNSSKKRQIELQSYKIIFILKDVDPKYPTEGLSTILRNSEVNFEIEKIERITDSKNKSMNKN